MNSVNFSKCSLVVLDGAKVTLNRCCFSDCALGVFASGEGTGVTAKDTTVSGGMQSMTVCNGAEVTCSKLTCTGWKGRGITLSDVKSSLSVTDGTFEPAACTDNELAQNQLHALWVHSGSTCSLTSTRIEGSWRGIYVAASEISLTDCTLCGSLACGVMIDAGGQGLLTGCVVTPLAVVLSAASTQNDCGPYISRILLCNLSCASLKCCICIRDSRSWLFCSCCVMCAVLYI
jgi:hypothetical protein